ncbi:SDR family NAD(P)-dependent oxidoreductase [Nocardioides humi]|uniref:3-oxoacyl-ACP reductase FabG n=1 Tax=Nocardioides humi TaxID=449461 RepID=A0ABN2A5Z6_9ACTN|nr:SDR family oxidoreductase [Nocardioides humi]
MTVAPDVSNRSLADLYSLAGRVALVTGGGRGIGAAVATRLAEAGAAVAIADIDESLATETAEKLAAGGATAVAVAMDVTSPESTRQAVAAVRSRLGEIDILVNNAGLLGVPSPYDQIADEDFDRTMAVNVRGVLNVSRVVGPLMVAASRPGVIINMASTATYRYPNPGTLTYTTSKQAVNAITKGLAVELGPAGIRVLDIAPVVVETPGLIALRERSREEAAKSGKTVELGNPAAFAHLPLGRTALPDDIARVVAFAASDAAILMTGSTLAVDAGSMVVR